MAGIMRLRKRHNEDLRERKHPRSHTFIFAALGSIVIVLGGAIFYLWNVNRELESLSAIQPVVYYSIPEKQSFIDADGSIDSDGGEVFKKEKERLIKEQTNFIEIDLSSMKIVLHENGKEKASYQVQAKGKQGSWWETTTGIYSVGSKSLNHFSSISKVWMPYGIQFYGNFFIHGWPYYSDGTPLPFSSSGGCIRLKTEDAEKIYEFAKFEMPVLVFDEKPRRTVYTALRPAGGNVVIPAEISADAAIVADLDTSELVLSKNSDSVLPIGSITKLMTALTASEVVNLDRFITAQKYMISDGDELFLAGKKYKGFDILYPLLMQSSDSAALILSAFLGTDLTVLRMNEKARALGMRKTFFVDTTGLSPQNASTLIDVSKLAKYILDKRGFIFGVSRGAYYPEQANIVFSSIKNKNLFAGEKGLVGVSSGLAESSGETAFIVWNMKADGATDRNIMIAVTGAKDAERDINILKKWIKDNFGFSN